MRKLLILTIINLISGIKSEKNDSSKYDGYFGWCPLGIMDVTLSSRSTDYLQMRLVVANDADHIYNISKAASIINDAAFKKEWKTLLFIHGWIDSPKISSPLFIKEAYLTRGGYNIILMDTSSVTNSEYMRAARAARYIGIRIGKILSQMIKSGLNVNTLDVVGYSLGAHIAGYVGKTYFKTMGKKLPRIVGMDPAKICFSGPNPNDRLDKTDAEFVQIVHTSGDSVGIMRPIGHVDFYLNGGRSQPSEYSLTCLIICSHLRVVGVWVSAVVHPRKFVGVRCNSIEEMDKGKCEGNEKAFMGHLADPKVKGIFNVLTTNKPPYY